MKKLIELAGKIRDKRLRKKIIDFLKDPKLSNEEFKKYPRTRIEDVRTPFSIGGSGSIRDVLNHTVAVVDLCMKTADSVEANYGIPINRDYLLAGAILHDIMKIYEWKNEKGFPR